ncbi:MAG: hypothetical protein AAF224_12805 [Pseudomonadota bacterium]
MMKHVKRAIIFTAAIAASGSVAMAASVSVSDAVPSDAEERAIDYVEGRLENPRGARVSAVSEPYKVYADFDSYEDVPAWAVDVKARMRLKSGGSGAMPYTVVFVDGEPIAVDNDDVSISER